MSYEKPEISVTFDPVDTFTDYGCDFKGNLVVIKYWHVVEYLNKHLPLDGFGRCTHYKVQDIIMERLRMIYPNGFVILLGVPILVIKLNEFQE